MIKTFFISILIVFLLNGCITKELPSYKTYSLTTDEISNIKESSKKLPSINITEPKTITSYNSRDILYSKDEISYNKYALNKWIDKPSKMLQKQIAKHLTSTNKYNFATTSNLKIESDYNLISQLVDFYQIFEENSSYAKFTIRVYLMNNKTQEVSFKNFNYYKKCSSNDALGFVKSINELTKVFYNDLDNFIGSSIQ